MDARQKHTLAASDLGSEGGARFPEVIPCSAQTAGELFALPERQLFGNIYSLPVDGMDVRAIRKSATYLGFPDVSPDGRSIVYVSESSDFPAVWISDINGTNPRQLTNSKFPEESPIFSGDGTSIAFVRRMSIDDPNYSASEMFMIDINGQSEKRLTDDRYVDSPVRFSRDGAEIYFLSDRSWNGLDSAGKSSHLFKMSLATLSISPVLQLNLSAACGCDLSMDETTVVFVDAPNNDFVYEVYTCNLDGSDRQKRSELSSYVASVRFGFHSDRFVFIEQRNGRTPTNLYLYDISSSNTRQIKMP